MANDPREFLLEAKELKKHYPVTSGLLRNRVIGWVKALDGVSLTIRENRIIGLVGESGSGKTTLAKTFLLLEKPTGGELLFCGRDLLRLKGEELACYHGGVQAVFQDPYSSLSPRRRIWQIIVEPLEMCGSDSRGVLRERAAALLALVGLDGGLLDRFPHELSGGQRQRIAIARAVSTDSRIIVLDEPTSALDVSVRLQIIQLLMELQQRMGHSYLLIGHDLAMVAYMATEIAVMYLGRIVEMAPPRELLENTRHPYTQALIDSSLPDHPRQPRSRRAVTGEIAGSLNIPPGCRFHPRCAARKPRCDRDDPAPREVSPGHWVACHR